MSDSSILAPERLNKRIHVALPIRVIYLDGNQKPCLELACTYDISARGARVTGLRCVQQTGEIITIERGRNRAFCRVVWIGEHDSELRGQVGIQCVETDRNLWENELKQLEEIYEPLQREAILMRNGQDPYGPSGRRRYPRFALDGMADLLQQGPSPSEVHGLLKNLSQLGCLVSSQRPLRPGTELKLVLNVGSYDFALKGLVRHAQIPTGLGIQFRDIRKGDRQILQFLLRKLAEEEEGSRPKAKAAVIAF